MTNLTKQKQLELKAFLQRLREEHTDLTSQRAFNELELALTEKKYGLVWEKHRERVDEELEHNIPVFTEDKSKQISHKMNINTSILDQKITATGGGRTT